jgi:taurine--2-oxoglutarate transaminase
MAENGDQHHPTLAHFGHMGEAHPTIVEGDGTTVYDDNGKEYLDFTSQLYCVNAGHSNEQILDAIRSQLEDIQYVSSAMYNDLRTEFANKLVDVAPDGLESVFFSVTGSEANEAAMQIAREVQDGNTVLTRWRSYHGSTYATGGATGDPAMRTPIEASAATTGNVKFLPPFDGADAPFDAETEDELADEAIAHLEYVIKNQGPDSIAALMTEVVAGSSGAFTAPADYFDRLADLCETYDILLIVDEVITGFGRCGDWFGADTERLEPDLLTFAKGATSAYVPLAGVLVREDIAEQLRDQQPGIGQTFAGSPIGCAAGIAALDEYEDLIKNVRALKAYFESELRELQAHDVVGDVRGRGFLWALEFVDPETGDPIFDPRVESGDNPVTEVIHEARDRGLLVGSGRPGFQIMLGPPLGTTELQIGNAVDTLDFAIDEVFG